MKNLFISALALMGLGAMGTDAAAQFYVIKDGKVKVALDYTPDYVTFDNPMLCGGVVGDAVDLGLSVKWSSVNVGASKPEDYGNYYAWGETETKKNYSWSSYKFIKSGESNWNYISMYQTDDHYFEGGWYKNAKYYYNGGKTTLEASEDAAAANWKGDWVMPTAADWQELKANCDGKRITDYNGDGSNITGWLFTSKTNGKTIFLPAAGNRNATVFESKGVRGYYWSSAIDKDYSYRANYSYFNVSDFSTGMMHFRYYGCSVRPVCPASGATNGHTYVDLGLPSGKLWATCNVGASAPEENGDYFAWGETTAKSDYSWENYTGEPGKYEGDNIKTLKPDHDVATQSWGSEWRMPTFEELTELYNNTTRTWTKDYNGTGVKGYILTSKVEGYTNVSIFLPAAGYYNGSVVYDKNVRGTYWTKTQNKIATYSANELYFYSSNIEIGGGNRSYGSSVRPVCAK